MVDFVSAIATASQAIGLVNQLRDAQKAYNEAEWKLKVADLNGALADLKNALVDAKEEARAKDEELKRVTSTYRTWSETIVLSELSSAILSNDLSRVIAKPLQFTPLAP